MTCCSARKDGHRCEHDDTHNNGEYLSHKGSHPVVTEEGFNGIFVYHWKDKK